MPEVGRFDLGHSPLTGDSFLVDGQLMSAAEFGNYLAGFRGAYGGHLFGYLFARLGGVFIDVFETYKRGEPHDFDLDSVEAIWAGAARGFKERSLANFWCAP